LAAYNTGKAEGLGSEDSTAEMAPSAIFIPEWRLPPESKAAGLYLLTPVQMIQQHADTVQAVVTGIAEGQQYLREHPSSAESIVAAQITNFGISSPEIQQYEFSQVYLAFACPIYPTKAAYDNEVSIINSAQPTKVTLPFGSYVVTKFAGAAFHKLGYRVP
jgi:hypothetical protein